MHAEPLTTGTRSPPRISQGKTANVLAIGTRVSHRVKSVGESNAVFLRGVGGDAATEPHKTRCSGYPEEEFSGTQNPRHRLLQAARCSHDWRRKADGHRHGGQSSGIQRYGLGQYQPRQDDSRYWGTSSPAANAAGWE